MKTQEELHAFYDASLRERIEECAVLLQEGRRRARRVVLWMFVVWLIAVPIALTGRGGLLLAVAVAFIALIVFLVRWCGAGAQAKQRFMEGVVGELVRFADPALAYHALGSISRDQYKASALFPGGCDVYRGEDLVTGHYKGVEIAFSELHTQRKTQHTNSKGHTTTTYTTIFKGIFLVADFHKHFEARTVVLPDTAEKIFGSLVGNFFQKANFSHPGKLIRMEDPVFEESFAVYAENEHEARYLLSPRLMEQLEAIRKRFEGRLYAAFIDSHLYLAIPQNANFFEPPKGGDYAFSAVERTFSEITTILRIVEDLALDVRIWSKGEEC